MYGYYTKEITKDDYDQILAGEKSVYDFFSEAEVAGYGASASKPFEDEGKYYIPYHMSDSCD